MSLTCPANQDKYAHIRFTECLSWHASELQLCCTAQQLIAQLFDSIKSGVCELQLQEGKARTLAFAIAIRLSLL